MEPFGGRTLERRTISIIYPRSMRALWFPLLAAIMLPASASGQDVAFSWDHATIYRLTTDRFSNGDSGNDYAYGRGLDGEGGAYQEDPSGHFQGGDYDGIRGWLEEGYFADLGVNTLWLSAPYEQVHGWVGGGDGDFQLYAYDASWPFDYTDYEEAFGGKDAFVELLEAAHENGQRVIVDVDVNHVGPPTMHDMAAYGFGGLTGEAWRTWQPSSRVGWQSYLADQVTLDDSLAAWQRWWGQDWVRADIVGYEACGTDVQTRCENGLPDLRSDTEVSTLPAFLALKWGPERTAEEEAELDAFFERTGARRTAANHVVKWLADWVRETPIDGFHVREAAGVTPEVLSLLSSEAGHAYRERHQAAGTKPTYPFLMIHDAAAAVPASAADVEWRALHAHDFTGNVVADVQSSLPTETQQVSGLPLRFVPGLATEATVDEVASFLLSAGPVVVHYGQETGRKAGPAISDARHQQLSSMNWSEMDEDNLSIWRALGRFRGSHPAIARGGFDQLQSAPPSFHRGVRIGMTTDQVIVAAQANGRTRINVSLVWPDDSVLKDVMTGKMVFVSYGEVSVTPHPSGIILLEEVAE